MKSNKPLEGWVAETHEIGPHIKIRGPEGNIVHEESFPGNADFVDGMAFLMFILGGRQEEP